VKWEELERRTDIDNVVVHGHTTERFPTSCVQAYEELCEIEGRSLSSSIAGRILLAAQSVFERDAPVVPRARETLERLRGRGARLALLTKGDPQVQEHRLKSSGLHDLFDVIQIVQEKSPDAIRAVVARLRVGLGSAWMVGNSVRSDILPALAAGLRAVWIDAYVWEYERTHDYLVDDRFVRARNLAEIPDLIVA